MTWRDRMTLRGGASFRGVPFYVDDIAMEQGRRTVVHRFPGSNRVAIQDLGLDVQTFSVTAYVIGPDYDTWRDQLEAALLQGGPADLVHPWRGSYTVEVTGPVRTRESKRDGGMAAISFDVTVVRPDEFRLLPVRRDTRVQVDLDATAFVDASVESFASRFSVEDLPQDLHRSAIEALERATEQIREANHAITAQLHVVHELEADIKEFEDAVEDLVHAPRGLAASLAELTEAAYSLMLAATAPPRKIVRMLLDAVRAVRSFGGDIPAVPSVTPQREREARNQAAVIWAHQALSAASLVRTIAGASFASFRTAREARDLVVDLLDHIAEGADDATYERVTSLRTSIVEHLDQVASPLPDIATYTPAVEMSALLLAHLLYGDAKREAEIVERNDPPHPGLLAPGEPLEVLSA